MEYSTSFYHVIYEQHDTKNRLESLLVRSYLAKILTYHQICLSLRLPQ